MHINSKIISVATYLPQQAISISDVEKRILDNSSAKKLPVRSVQRLTGVEQVFHRAEGENASDLAVKAAHIALHRASVSAEQIDLLIFASASQDLIEPATAHIIAAELGLTSPVFDIKNACNSFLNGMQVADSFIRSGTYKTILIVTGETSSVSMRWNCTNREEFVTAFPGFSMSDSGGAVLLQGVEEKQKSGVLSIEMTAHSGLWEVGILGTGGSRYPRDIDATYFNMNGHSLYQAFRTVGCDMLFKKVKDKKLNWDDFSAIGMHQVSHIYNDMLIEELGLPAEKTLQTIQHFGNVASNSLPLQLEMAINSKKSQPGDLFCFIGLGGGISTGIGVFKL